MRPNLDTLPYPLATGYRRIQACHEPDARRLRHVLQTAEMTTRFLAAVVLSDLRDRVKAGEIPPPPALTGLLERLRRPAFGHWVEILREGTRTLTDASDGFMPELQSLGLTGKGGSEIHGLGLLGELNALRNRFAHGDMSAAEIRRACEEGEGQVQELLGALAFLAEYRPFFVRRIWVRKHRLENEHFTHEFWLLAGPYQDPEAVREERNWHTDTDEVILQRPDAAYLSLDPLLLYLDSERYDAASGIRPDLYVFDGYTKRGDTFVLRYLPSGPSGEAFTSEVLPDETARGLLVRGLTEYGELFSEAA